MDEVLHKLIEFVESASPVVWTAAQQQVQARIMGNWIWVGILGILFLFFVGLTIVAMVRYDGYNMWDVVGAFSGLFVVITLVIFGSVLTEVIMMMNNPLWYAIKALGELVP